MKTQYLKQTGVLENTYLRITLASSVSGGAPEPMDWADLKSYKVTLETPKKSGAYMLDDDESKRIYYSFDNNGRMTILLNNLEIGVLHRLTVVVAYGTETRAQYIFDIERVFRSSIRPIYINATLIAVETIGDGTGTPFDPTELELEIAGKADGSIYRVGDDDEAIVKSHGFSIVTGNSPQFAIDTNGNLVLYNEGTPVVLTPAKLAELIS